MRLDKWKAFLLSAAVTLYAGHSIASSSEVKSINLQEAIAKTFEYNPALRALKYQLKAQDGQIEQASISPGMNLSLDLEDTLGTGAYSGINNSQVTFSVAWVLERGIRQSYIDVANANKVLMSSSQKIIQLDAAAETAKRYLVSLAFQSRKLNADESVKLAEETIKTVEKRVSAGKTPEAELSRAKAELIRRKLEREDMEHELESANRQLASQWGEVDDLFQRVEGNLLFVPNLPTFEKFKSYIKNNPQFTQILSNQRLKQAELDLELKKAKPSWQLSAGLRHYQESGNQALVGGISIPFGKGTRNTGRILEARANLEESSIHESILKVQIETDLFVLYEKLQHSLHVMETYREEIIPTLGTALKQTRRAYNLGRYSYLELRSVQNEVLEANNALLEASINAHENIIEIERITGVQIAQLNKP